MYLDVLLDDLVLLVSAIGAVVAGSVLLALVTAALFRGEIAGLLAECIVVRANLAVDANIDVSDTEIQKRMFRAYHNVVGNRQSQWEQILVAFPFIKDEPKRPGDKFVAEVFCDAVGHEVYNAILKGQGDVRARLLAELRGALLAAAVADRFTGVSES